MIQKISGLLKHEGFKRYSKNTYWMLIEKVFRIIANLFIGIWVIRYLGPKEFGTLSYVQSFVGIFAALSTLGLNGIIVNELVKNPNRKNEVLGTSFTLRMITSLSLTVTLIILGYLFNANQIENILLLLISSSTIFQSFNILEFYFQSTVDGKLIAFSNIISLTTIGILKVGAIMLKLPVMYFGLILLIEAIVLSLSYVFFYKRKKFAMRNWFYSKSTAKELLHKGWPLVLSGFVITIYMKIDQVMIKNILNEEMVGNYSAAVKISEAWYFLPMIIVSSLFPALVNKFETKSIYLSRLSRLYQLLILLSVFVAIPLTFLSDTIITLFYGNLYALASDTLTIHIWTGLFVSLSVISGRWVIIEKLQRVHLVYTTLGAILNIVLNLLFIPKFGILGAAYSTLISQSFSSYFLLVLNKRTREYFNLITKSIFNIKHNYDN